jgi:hypothetical protein
MDQQHVLHGCLLHVWPGIMLRQLNDVRVGRYSTSSEKILLGQT